MKEIYWARQTLGGSKGMILGGMCAKLDPSDRLYSSAVEFPGPSWFRWSSSTNFGTHQRALVKVPAEVDVFATLCNSLHNRVSS
jgi:hypothetical protein